MKVWYRYFVYIVECSGGAYYTGITNDVERRVSEHNTGIDPKCFTYSRRPVVLKCCLQFNDVKQAISVEKQIKGWSRKKKEALINENWTELQILSRSQ